MSAAGRGSTCQIGLCRLEFRRETGYEIGREKWRVGRDADDKRTVGPMRRAPIEPCQYTGERSCEIGHAVRDYREPEISEAGGVAIGVEHKRCNLWAKALDHPLEHRSPAQHAQGLVASPHTAGLTAGEQQADDFHAASSATLDFRVNLGGSSPTVLTSLSKTMRWLPASATKRLPLARPIKVSPACRARSTPQAVKPDREIRIGIPICTVLITISEVSRPVV